MSVRILIAYATHYGSTQEVAEAIAAALRERGLEVDARPMRQVRTLKGYRMVVLGTPIYMGHWLGDVNRFLLQYREALTQQPVTFFALGPTHTGEEEWRGARAQFDQELAKFPWLTPITTEMFGGRFDPANLRFPDNLIARLPASPLHNQPASDVRDWTAVRAWASNLAEKHLSALSR